MVPFIQLGISYYLSVQIVAFIVLILIVSQRIERRAALFAVGGAAVFGLKIVELLMIQANTHDFLVVLREALCYSVMLLAFGGLSRMVGRGRLGIAEKVIFPIMIASVLLIVWQFIAIKNDAFVSFDKSWFIMNQPTLAGVKEALLEHSRLRPVGFYGEPSYMAFVMISILLVGLFYFRKAADVVLLCGMCLIGLLLLGSLSGVLAYGILVAAYFLFRPGRRNLATKRLVGAFTILGVLSICLVWVLPSEYYARIAGILNNGISHDTSANIRFVLPSELLLKMAKSGQWVGYTASALEGFINGRINSIDNALLWVLLEYGMLGIVLLGLYITYIRNVTLVAYFIVCLNFNGSIFSYDKAVIVSIALGLCLGIVRAKGGIHEGRTAIAGERGRDIYRQPRALA